MQIAPRLSGEMTASLAPDRVSPAAINQEPELSILNDRECLYPGPEKEMNTGPISKSQALF